MAFFDVYFSLGSNLGDRKANIENALSKMNDIFGVSYSKLSTLIETESWGFVADRFINCAVLYSLELDEDNIIESGLDILSKCKSIEKALGREDYCQYDCKGNRIYESRTIDIDILFIGKEVINTEKLTIPHPLIGRRDFVLIPLREIAKDDLKQTYPVYFNL